MTENAASASGPVSGASWSDPAGLRQALQALYAGREQHLKAAFDRSLPFADAVLDNRWERARRLGFGEGSSIYDTAIVFGEVVVGHQTWIGPGVILDGSGGSLRIGSFCSISAGVHIYTHDTVRWALSGGLAPQHVGPVRIGDCCHIGAQSIVIAGVEIGEKCVVAANSFVNRNVLARTIVGGSPARLLGRVVGDGVDIELVFDEEKGP